MAQGFIVLAAARAAQAGASLAQVVERARALIPKVELIAALDTLEYAVRGGRVAATLAQTVSNVLRIKPLVQVQDGQVSILGQARSHAKAVRRLVDTLVEKAGDAPLHIAVLYSDALEEAERFRDELKARFRCVEAYLTSITPVLGVHSGPGVMALAYYVGE